MPPPFGPFDLFGDTSGLPHTTASGIPYEIESLTPKLDYVPRANRTVVHCRVRAFDAEQFVTDMVGRVFVAGSLLRRDLPERNPDRPKQFCARCEQVDQGGGLAFDQGPEPNPVTGWPLPKWVKFRVTFEGMGFDLKTDAEISAAVDEKELYRYVRRSRKAYSKEQGFPGGGFYVTGSGPPKLKIAKTGFKVVAFADVQYTHFRVPVDHLPLSNFDDCIGRVNSALWDFGARGAYNWAAETLLYEGFDDEEKYWDANGDWVVDVVHSFKYRAIGWNLFLNAAGVAVPVDDASVGTGNEPYEVEDFNKLFQYA